jgi:hypothetical protein
MRGKNAMLAKGIVADSDTVKAKKSTVVRELNNSVSSFGLMAIGETGNESLKWLVALLGEQS